jgi:hypothetical protein
MRGRVWPCHRCIGPVPVMPARRLLPWSPRFPSSPLFSSVIVVIPLPVDAVPLLWWLSLLSLFFSCLSLVPLSLVPQVPHSSSSSSSWGGPHCRPPHCPCLVVHPPSLPRRACGRPSFHAIVVLGCVPVVFFVVAVLVVAILFIVVVLLIVVCLSLLLWLAGGAG